MNATPTRRPFVTGTGRACARAAICLVLLAALVICTLAPAAANKGEVYSVAVIPSSPPVALHAQWTPFLDRLSEQTGVRFRLKLFERMADFEQEIAAGSADFIFASPIQAVVAHQTNRYLPLVRGGKPVAIGLFVRRDSSLRTLQDLSGKTISFVGNKNLCSVFVRHLLADQKEKLSFASEYTGSTRNVIQRVLLGKSAAGAVFIPELEREPAENREQLRSIVETPKIAPHPLAVHPRVPRAVRESVQKGVLGMAATREGRDMLKSVRMADPVAADYQKDYQVLELIDVRLLTDWGK